MEPSIWLSHAWAFLIALSIVVYVVLDGFDLGMGILYPFFPKRSDRDILMNSVAPVWDGNETWLVLGVGGLFAAFPLAYAIILPALYTPMMLLLFALIFRGVSFEFRWRTERGQRIWNLAFTFGSILAAFAQGLALGAILQGIEVEGRAYAGGWWGWLSPFSVLTGVSVVAGYALLGSTWLMMKTDGPINEKARRLAWRFAVYTVTAMVLVSLATPFLEGEYYRRWFTPPGIFFAAPVPLAVAVTTFALFRAINIKKADYTPFFLSLTLFFLSFVGLAVSMYPYVVPGKITIFEAATAPQTQLFMFVGACIMLPIILGYTAYGYWVFRGKMDPEEGYH